VIVVVIKTNVPVIVVCAKPGYRHVAVTFPEPSTVPDTYPVRPLWSVEVLVALPMIVPLFVTIVVHVPLSAIRPFCAASDHVPAYDPAYGFVEPEPPQPQASKRSEERKASLQCLLMA
jgi:hypothetical protein